MASITYHTPEISPALYGFLFFMFVLLLGGVCCYCCMPAPADICPSLFTPSTYTSVTANYVPSGSYFVRKTDPAKPPKLVIESYKSEDIRSDRLPLGEERYWQVDYQPKGNPPREVLRLDLYLWWEGGDIRGVGVEAVRGACKVSGIYKYNPRSNLTVAALEARYTNGRDKVVLHAVGIGTGFNGNCYVSEGDQFAFFSGVPVLEMASITCFKGSFRMLLRRGMGDNRIYRKLHGKRMAAYAGLLMPVRLPEDVSSPRSDDSTPRGTPRGSGDTQRSAGVRTASSSYFFNSPTHIASKASPVSAPSTTKSRVRGFFSGRMKTGRRLVRRTSADDMDTLPARSPTLAGGYTADAAIEMGRRRSAGVGGSTPLSQTWGPGGARARSGGVGMGDTTAPAQNPMHRRSNSMDAPKRSSLRRGGSLTFGSGTKNPMYNELSEEANNMV